MSRNIKILKTEILNNKSNNNRFIFTMSKKKKVFLFLFLLLTLSLLLIPRDYYKSTIRKLLAYAGIYTEEIKSMEIESNNYDDPASFKITKSSKWLSTNKVQISFDVDSIIKKDDRNKDIIIVLDTSITMDGSKLNELSEGLEYLIDNIISENNRFALIEYNETSQILSNFTSNKAPIINLLNNLHGTGQTNYNLALQKIDTLMTNYVKKDDTDVVALFITGSFPSLDTPSEAATYSVLKEKYPFLTINGIQYAMGNYISAGIQRVSDNQFNSNNININNVLLEASVSTKAYEKFIIEDYIDTDYFNITSTDEIDASIGEANIVEESGEKKIVWNLGDNSFITGTNESMSINLTLNNPNPTNKTYSPTNTKSIISYKIDEVETEKNTTDTLVLSNLYKVTYDNNTPEGCTLSDIPTENHLIFQSINKKTEELSCENYIFKGWKISDQDDMDINHINEDLFIMPTHDVTIRGEWSSQSIKKTMDGEVNTHATLYKVIKDEQESGGVARKYTGEHHDSFTEEPSEDIYYFYASNNANAELLLEKNNVIFAGHCWQMIRTTDTGGVKLLYNGEASSGKCLDTRDLHVGYTARAITDLTTNYWYGTDYTYDSTNKVFSLSGTTEQTIWNDSTSPSLIGKYTCKSTNETDTCATIHLVESYYNENGAYTLPLNSNQKYSSFGYLRINSADSSISDAGYMYNNRYPYKYKSFFSTESLLGSASLSTTFWYADSISFDSTTNKYILNNPYQVSDTTDYPNLVGKYTFRNTNQGYTNADVNYIVGINGENMYYFPLTNSGNHTLSDFNTSYTYGDSYTDNGNGTYSINNPTTIYRSDWYNEYSNINNKYVCKDATNNTCSNLIYTTTTNTTSYEYTKVTLNYKYSNSITWDGSKYILDNDTSKTMFEHNNANLTSLNNTHYTCWNITGECTSVSYIYAYESKRLHYINLSNGEDIESALEEALSVNRVNSVIKTGTDAWYKHFMLDYDEFVEDTIYCNDRSISNLNGWNPNGGNLSAYLTFTRSNVTNDLSCSKTTDKFSVNNNDAKLTYKVGLITAPEIKNTGAQNTRVSPSTYWTITPNYVRMHFGVYQTNGWQVQNNGNLFGYIAVSSEFGLRPVISLKPEIEYSKGNGSKINPYIVDTEISYD